nr:GMC oxidoreductase [Streptomyces sp. NBC_00830]
MRGVVRKPVRVHQTGATPGPDDPTTVVAPDCGVLGMDGLRVVDASIFPAVPRANTHLAAVMVGELMADRM